MRAVLLGTDLMYDKSGRLVPIEINTNVGYDSLNRVEKSWLDLSKLIAFLKENEIEEVVLDYSTHTLRRLYEFRQQLEAGGIAVVLSRDITSEVDDDKLIVRVQYSDEALVDSFCRDKIEFLKMINNSSKISQEFLYKENGEVKGVMNDFVDNGSNKPNYILKYRYPQYDTNLYPAYYKFNSLVEVQDFAEQMEDDFLIMPCYLNEDNMYGGERYVLLRQWSLLIPDENDTLKAIDLGSYTKVSGKVDLSQVEFDETGKMVAGTEMFNTKLWTREIAEAFLEEGDQILMSDASWKAIEDIEVGDTIRSIDIPFADNVDIKQHVGDYNVDENTLKSESKYAEGKVTYVGKVSSFQDIVHIKFKGSNEELEDAAAASYPTLDPQDGSIRFKRVGDLIEGDKIFLIDLQNSLDLTSETVNFVERVVESTSEERVLVDGYTISVDGSHLFISKGSDNSTGYVTIMHNYQSCEDECTSVGYAGAYGTYASYAAAEADQGACAATWGYCGIVEQYEKGSPSRFCLCEG